MKPTVYAVRCESYDQVEEKAAELLEMMGGMAQFVTPGETAALKVNLLSASDPEKAVTTHPAVTAAVGRQARKAGAEPVIMDSPSGAYPHTKSALTRVYRACGMEEAAERSGLELNFDTRVEVVSYPDGKLIQHFEIMAPLLEAGAILNLSKLKTHALMTMTGAVKNMFGAIPGRIKPGYHAKLASKDLFAKMLLDLAACVAPRLSIMDAVVGMEGDGPGNGDPRQVGLLLGAENPLALDVAAGEIMGLDFEDNPLLVEAEKQGRTPTRLEEIDLVGIDPAALRIPDFQLPATHAPDARLRSASWLQQLVSPLFKDALTLEPRVIEEACIACEDCVNICPMGVIDIRGEEHQHAWIDEQGCIRCYCCHETCPQDAIELHRSLLYRVVIGQKKRG